MSLTGFDIRALQYGFKAHKKRGIGIYTRNLIQRVALAPDGFSIQPFHDSAYEAQEPAGFGSKPFMDPWFSKLRPLVRERVWSHFLFKNVMTSTLKRAGCDMVFFPTHLDVPAGMNFPYAVTAHDMIQAALREVHYTSVKSGMDINRQIKALQGAQLILAVSSHTKEDVVRYAGVDPDKVRVISNGVDPEFKPGVSGGLGRFDLPERFVLHVGGIDWRKNIGLLFSAFLEVSRRAPDAHLVMTGEIENDPQYRNFLSELKKLGLENRVHPLGFVSRSELIALYNRAEIFFYPSLYEGFGLPALEAMACGTPVISTDCSSLPEVTGGAAILLGPDEPEPFADAITGLLESQSERERLSTAGLRQAAKFSWDKCAKETYAALASIM